MGSFVASSKHFSRRLQWDRFGNGGGGGNGGGSGDWKYLGIVFQGYFLID